jgi:pimeloyl-ACP methyl ester carboxylesterase
VKTTPASRGTRTRSRLTLAAVGIALLTALAAIGAPAPASAARHDPKPTIVFAHGAFASPAGWGKVARALQRQGYETATPALELQSAAGDESIVRATLDAIPGKKILVGHSYGGFVISNAALGRTDVLGLVYTAAYVPDAGESIQSLNAGYRPPAFLVPGHLIFAPAFPDVIIDPQYFHDDFAQDLKPKPAAELAAAQHPTSLAILDSTSGAGAWHTLPSWYAISGADRVIDPDLQRFMAQRAHSTIVTFEHASHAGGFTHFAARFVKLIDQAVRATVG